MLSNIEPEVWLVACSVDKENIDTASKVVNDNNNESIIVIDAPTTPPVKVTRRRSNRQ